jgi:hypothetical protein
MKKRHLWIAFVAVGLLCCCCLPALLLVGLMISDQPAQTAEATMPIEVEPQVTFENFATPPLQQIPQETLNQMREIEAQVSSLRNLETEAEPTVVLLTPTEFEQRITEQFDAARSPQWLSEETSVLLLLGMLPQGADLRTLFLRLYARPMPGYYDMRSGELVLINGRGFKGPQRMAYAREFTHVLQDQHYNLLEGLDLEDDKCLEDPQACAAVNALVQGDAALVEQLWYFSYATEQDQQQLRESSDRRMPDMTGIPAFMAEDLIFPYREGLKFVQSVYDQKGWPGIERLYRNPPVSTEQILHPERYPADQPLEVDLPNLTKPLTGDWQEVRRQSLGEWYVYLMLAFADNPTWRVGQLAAQQAADGWGGDQYVLLTDPQSGRNALVWVTQWDSETEAYDFWTTFKTYGMKRWQTPLYQGEHQFWWADTADGSVRMWMDGPYTGLVIAPDEEMASSIVNFLESEFLP